MDRLVQRLRVGEEIYRKLKEKYKINLDEFIAPRVKHKDLFEFIIGVLLSQNTSDKNAIRAYNNLLSNLGSVTPEKILMKKPEEIALLIKPAGTHFQRAKRIIELAKIFSDNEFVSKLVNRIKNSTVEEGRKILMSLPGVGEKTADIVLLMYFGKPVFPVDTHIRRVTKRLGYVKKNNYETISRWWMSQLEPRDYLIAHLLLITHGRKTFKARKPKCRECPIKDLCKYYSKTTAHP